MEVKHDVQLTHVREEVIERLDEEMDEFEVCHVVVADVDAEREEEAGVAAVDELQVAVLDEVGEGGLAGGDEAVDLHLLAVALGVVAGDVPLDHAGLAHAVLDEEEVDHEGFFFFFCFLQEEKENREETHFFFFLKEIVNGLVRHFMFWRKCVGNTIFNERRKKIVNTRTSHS